MPVWAIEHMRAESLAGLQPLLPGALLHSMLPGPELLCWHKIRFRLAQA